MAKVIRETAFYNESYKRRNYFRYPQWLYGPYVSSLIAFSGVKRGDSLLDIGCGQGFFSYLFFKQHIKVFGVDLSDTGVNEARNQYGKFGITFAVADITTANFPKPFDCVFVRSCSLYNSDAFAVDESTTVNLLRHLKPGGMFIFVYNSNFSSRKSPTWRYHSLGDVKKHFSSFGNVDIFCVNKVTTFLCRRYSFNRFVTRLNMLLSKMSGCGGELVCILRKPSLGP